MKLILSLVLILLSTGTFSQKIDTGGYESEQGSILNIKKNNRFEYFKSNYRIEGNQIYVWGFSYQASGKFKKKNNLLILNSEESIIKNNSKENGVVFNIKELKAQKNNFPDSISIKVNFDSNILKLYICDTPQEDLDYWGSCIKLIDKNKFATFKGNFFIRIYPNLNNPENRLLKQKTVYFDTERFKKKDHFSDLEIDLEFDNKYFSYEYFKDEIMLIENGKIYHEGQEFVLKE